MKKIIIAIDGYSGTGKSSTARAVAKKLGYLYIDSGAMYRAATLHFLEQAIDLSEQEAIKKGLRTLTIEFADGNRVLLNGEDVSREIRSMPVNRLVSRVSAIPDVRKALVAQQQKLGTGKGIVMDGRDIGTVVFPGAELKVFMTARPEVRAKRRQLELEQKGIREELKEIETNLLDRDKLDSGREASPLIKTKDSIEIDTSELAFDDQVERVVSLAKELIYES